ncbi:MAG TPA: DUF192 domain-containing protein [Xanthobacteraceae bacterium]|nr:DUF192 domain-containing protein [Xanthobacteraceae bacterium]
MVAGFWLAASPAAQALTVEQLEIVTKDGVRVFEVEMAETPEEQETGLMYRRELADGKGMLFDMGEERPAIFWMKNTYVSLDMIFIRGDGTIANIARNTTPLSEARIYSSGPVRGVLEVVAGTAKRYGIVPGDHVGHWIFSGH